MPQNDKTISKFLSLVLRHEPDRIELSLDTNGWANVQELVEKAQAHHVPLTIEKLKDIVASNDKQRFIFSEDGTRIRANQGHSIEVDLQLQMATPPVHLYHGTAIKNIAAIKAEGLQKRQRHHVHLSADKTTAAKVGARYGKPVVLSINAQQMHAQGYTFFLSTNGVWLTDRVPPEYIQF